MATRKPLAVEPDQQYRVKVKRPIQIGRATLTPVTDNVVKGKVLSTLPEDAIEHYEPI
jgi:hypothetical protein